MVAFIWLPSRCSTEISFTQYQGPAEAKYSEIWLAVVLAIKRKPTIEKWWVFHQEKVWYNKREEKIRPSKLKSSYG